MTEQETKDLAQLKETIRQAKENNYSYMLSLSRMNENELESCGYRNMTREAAMAQAFLTCVKTVNRHTTEFLKKYPDSK